MHYPQYVQQGVIRGLPFDISKNRIIAKIKLRQNGLSCMQIQTQKLVDSHQCNNSTKLDILNRQDPNPFLLNTNIANQCYVVHLVRP